MSADECTLKERAREEMMPPRAMMDTRNQNHLTVVTTETAPMYKHRMYTTV